MQVEVWRSFGGQVAGGIGNPEYVVGSVRFSKNACVFDRDDFITVLGGAEFGSGSINAYRVRNGSWEITCGCRTFAVAEALEHWSSGKNLLGRDRSRTLRAVKYLAREIKKRKSPRAWLTEQREKGNIV